jgi:DNA polymerase-3 subunit alpha
VIANVGKAATAIIEARSSKGPFESIFDLCRRVDLHQMNKKSLESIAMAGALDCLPGTRAQLFAAIETAVEYGNSFQKDSAAGQTDLFSMMLGGGEQAAPVVAIPQPALPGVQPWAYNELLNKEKEVLNFYVSGHPLDHYRDEVLGFSNYTLKPTSLAEMKNGADTTIAGMIISMRNHMQKNGKPMAFLELEDFEGSIELVAFGDAFEQYRHLLATDAMVLVKGKIDKREEQKPKIIVDKVLALSESREKLARSVHVRLRTQGLEDELIKDIYSCCSQAQGNCRLIIHLVTQEQNEYKIRAKELSISSGKEFIDTLRKKLGKDNVWLAKTAA